MSLPRLVAALLLLPRLAAAAPKDFDQFWDQTKQELASVPMEPKLVADPDVADKSVACFKASYRSLNRTIHARYCCPARQGKFPAVVISPWYSEGYVERPVALAEAGFAVLSFQARGFEVDQSSYPIENSWYILDGIDDPKTYIYREIVAHALRGIDFVAARPEVDPRRIGAMGASQGGGLSLLAAELDPRVKAVAADFPFLSDWERSLKDATHAPYTDVANYISERRDRREPVMRTVSYFDTLDAPERIRVPTLVLVGLKDRTCPPKSIKNVFARIGAKDKTLKEFPDADHVDRNAERWNAATDFIVKTLKNP